MHCHPVNIYKLVKKKIFVRVPVIDMLIAILLSFDFRLEFFKIDVIQTVMWISEVYQYQFAVEYRVETLPIISIFTVLISPSAIVVNSLGSMKPLSHLFRGSSNRKLADCDAKL